jgi:hypothetical protein
MTPYVHICHICLRQSATWSADVLPKGWKRYAVDRVICRRCCR